MLDECQHDRGSFGLSWSPTSPCDGLGLHARPPSRPSCPQNTKTDQTHGRSVALLALPHPKCPFQVELLRVRASYCCFLVLGYYEVPGLYGYRTDPVNTAPYLSLDSLEGRRHRPRARPCASRLRSGEYCSAAAACAPLDPIQTQQGNLDMSRRLGSTSKTLRARRIPRSKCPVPSVCRRRHVPRSRGRTRAASRDMADAHSSYSKSSANRPLYGSTGCHLVGRRDRGQCLESSTRMRCLRLRRVRGRARSTSESWCRYPGDRSSLKSSSNTRRMKYTVWFNEFMARSRPKVGP